MLTNLARSLDEQHPGAAASRREGREDLLTVKRLGLGGSSLERTLSSTNVIENLIGQAREAFARFFGRQPPRERDAALRERIAP